MYNTTPPDGIAIIGMAGRFPGAKNIAQFWQNLRNGVESITEFLDDDLKKAGVPDELLQNPNYVKSGVVLEDIELFDAGFFGYTPREAELMDPQQRFFLMCAWEALEHSGCDAARFDGPIGVFGGVSMNSYLLRNLLTSGMMDSAGLQAVLGNGADFLATRVSYKLDLKGPSVDVQTSCSTSLVAVHLACQSLLNSECDMALAGGASISVLQGVGYLYQEQGIYSPDGRCRAFDANANGTAGGRGAAIVVLKRVEDALSDGDTIYAVIRGSAINNDGADKIGFTAPSVEGQANVIAEALAVAGVEPESIGYVETHGTGTPLGDPIEIEALTQAFRASTDRKQFCAIGALKTNVGHLDAAAGTASLIKTALSLYHQEIPPSLNYEKPNPKINFENSPFFVSTKLAKWESTGLPRRAGVSSFGMGGTNAHVVLEEAVGLGSGGEGEKGGRGAGSKLQVASGLESPPGRGRGGYENAATTTANNRQYQLLLLSAKTENALDSETVNLAAHLKSHPEQELADVAWTLQTGRKQFGHRRILVCETRDNAIKALADSGKLQTGFCGDSAPEVAFMFTGQGAQYVNMGKDLYESEPVFREEVDRSCAILQPVLGFDLRELVYPDLFGAERRGLHSHAERGNEMERGEMAEKLKQTAVTQPALFVIEYALAQLWQSWGIMPQAMIGHSIGEYVAACLAGVFSLEDALALVAKRGQLMQDLPAGAMLAVPLPAGEVEHLIDGQLDIAVINEPSRCVVSGTLQAIEALEKTLKAKGIEGRRLQTSHAFHSAMMDGILEEFAAAVGKIELHKPEIPYISNVTGRWITGDEATDPGYYARHLRQAVLFADGVKTLLEEPNRLLLEVGPGRTLATLAKQQAEREASGEWRGRRTLHSLRHPQVQENDSKFILQTLGQLWLAGCEIDWKTFHGDDMRKKVPLPTYPFEYQRYWVEPGDLHTQQNGWTAELQKKPDIADWFYVPTWKRCVVGSGELRVKSGGLAESSTPHTPLQNPHSGRWLIFADASGLGERLGERLQVAGCEVIIVKPGERFARTGERAYTIDPQRREDYDALVAECRAQMIIPNKIFHAWSVSANGVPDKVTELGFFSLIFIVQAFASWNAKHELQITVLTSDVHDVIGTENIQPEKALIGGPCKVIPQEYPNFSCRSIDVATPASRKWQDSLIDALMAELVSDAGDSVVAFRGEYCWTQQFEPVRLGEQSVGLQSKRPTPGPFPNDRDKLQDGISEGKPDLLRDRGVYLVTGGTGGIGLEVAEFLAKTVQARLVLTGRSVLPEQGQWEKWLAEHENDDMDSRKICKLQALQSLGAEVIYRQADSADEAQMRSVVEEVEKRFGEIHGVIHAAGADKTAIIIQQITRNECEAQFRPKVQGLQVLEKVLQDRNLDFCIVQSSLSSVLGALGFVAYTAAHLFMDAFVQKHNRTHRTKWMSVNWDNWLNWKEPEIAFAGEEAALYMSAEEGTHAFGRVLSNGHTSQLIVSTGDLQARIARWLQRDGARADGKSEQEIRASRHNRPQLKNDFVAPEGETEQVLAEIWAQALGIDRVGRHDNFFELGGDSVLIIQIISKTGQAGLRITANQVFEHPTIAELAKLATQQENAAEQCVVSGTVPLTPIQRWFFERKFPEPNHFNLPMLLEVPREVGVDADILQKALAHLVRHHDALRLRFKRTKSGVEQSHSHPEEAVPFAHFDVSELSEAEQKSQFAAKSTTLQTSLDMTNGPVISAGLFTFGEKAPAKLLLAVHHLVVDVVSWRILLEDLQTVVAQLVASEDVVLPAKTTSFKQWSEKLNRHAQSEALAAESAYWLNLPWQRVKPLPVDLRKGKNLQGSVQTIAAGLDAEATRSLLQDVPQAYNTQINDVLLTVLLQTFAGWTNNSSLLLNMEAHGREEIFENIDLSRTVGWFTSLYPVLLTTENPAEIAATLKSAKEQIRRIPHKGIGYGLLRYLRGGHLLQEEKKHPPAPPQGGNEDRVGTVRGRNEHPPFPPEASGRNGIVRKLKSLPQPEVSFLYMGQFGQDQGTDALFRMSQEDCSPACSPTAQRQHLLDIVSLVREDRFRMEWMYSKNVYQRATIEKLAKAFIANLQAIIRHCREKSEAEFTPSDFPGARVSQDLLDQLLNKVG